MAARKKANDPQSNQPPAGAESLAINVPKPEMVKLSALNAAKYNPRVISDEEFASLKTSIQRFGMIQPLTVQRSGLTILAGHQRVRALRELTDEGVVTVPDKVPAVVLDVDDTDAKQINVAMNRIGGEFDPFRLGELLSEIWQQPTFSPEAMGFLSEQVEAMINDSTFAPDDEAEALEREAFAASEPNPNRSYAMSVEFESAEERDEARSTIREIAGSRKPGTVVLEALRAFASAADDLS